MLQTTSLGLGDARCIVFTRKGAAVDSTVASLDEKQTEDADSLYRSLRAAGEKMSRDEVRTRVALGEPTGASPSKRRIL
jgi:hypothetical protein